MRDYIGVHTICDTDKADGNVYFEKDYMEFRPRSYEERNLIFRVYYKDIKDVQGYKGLKSTVVVILEDGTAIKYYMYKMATFIELVNAGRQGCNDIDLQEPIDVMDTKPLTDLQLEKLERLNKLYKDGVLTKEQFEKEKDLILNR